MPRGSTRWRTRRAASARRRPRSTWPPASPRRATQALLVDLDPQANATSGLGEQRERHVDATTSSTARRRRARDADALRRTSYLVPSRPELAGAAVELLARDDGERFLADALGPARERYDFVFIDCPPSLGPLTVNALAAADRVLVPVQAEYYALEGLAQLLESIELVAARLNPKLGARRMSCTMVDGRTRLAADVAAEVRRHFGDLVFETVVPRSVRLAEAPSHGLPITALRPLLAPARTPTGGWRASLSTRG